MAFNTVKGNVCGDRYKHCHVTEFSYPVSSCPPTLTDGLQVCRKFWFFLKVTQDLRLNHGGGSVREATYKHGAISESMETDIIEKHSYAGHDCANPKSLYTKNAPRFTVLKLHTQVLWETWLRQRQLQKFVLFDWMFSSRKLHPEQGNAVLEQCIGLNFPGCWNLWDWPNRQTTPHVTAAGRTKHSLQTTVFQTTEPLLPHNMVWTVSSINW